MRIHIIYTFFCRLDGDGDNKLGVEYKNDVGSSVNDTYLHPLDTSFLSTSAVSNRSYMDFGQLARGRHGYPLDTHSDQGHPTPGGQGDPRAPSAHGVPSDHSDGSIQAHVGSRPTVWASAVDITPKNPDGKFEYDNSTENKYQSDIKH